MLEVPKSPTVYTTIYDGFKGVDYTNDMTSVYKKRSPDAINIMPDESGNPVKRFGWETVLTQDDLKQAASYSGDIEIYRCYYFTLSGVDHIMIFTSAGLFCYKDDALSVLSTNGAIVDSVDRAFFFEGEGTAAFYIYGSYKVWRYTYNYLKELTDEEVYIPTILATVPASGDGGYQYEEFNLIGEVVREEFQDNVYTESETTYYRTYISRFIPQSVLNRVKVWKFNDSTGDFDTQLTVKAQGETLSTDLECNLVSPSSGNSYIQYRAEIAGIAQDGADNIRVQYPAVILTTTTYPASGDPDIIVNGTAELVRR